MILYATELGRLRALAKERGDAVEPAIARRRWRLRREGTGELALTPTGAGAFTIYAAFRFLKMVDGPFNP